MSFTDKDLALLKESFCEVPPRDERERRMQALIMRLKAAEALVEKHSGHDDDCDEVNCNEGRCSCGYDADIKVHLKSKGE